MAAPAPINGARRLRLGIDGHTLGARKTGNETYARGLSRGLAALADPGAECVLYVTRSGAAPSAGLTLRRLRLRHSVPRLLVGLPWALRRDRIDVALFQYVVPPLCPCPSVVAVHDISYEFHPEFFAPLERARMRALIPRSMRQARHVLTLSEFSRGQIVERYGIDPDRISVTPLAAEPAFRPIPDRDALLAVTARLALPQRFLLAVGNLQPRKNLARLLAAYADLRRNGRVEQGLVLVGQQAFRGPEILAAIQAHHLDGAVVTTGYVSDEELVALYNLADAFVYPSVYEGFGLPLVEAMACGTPVVCSNTASMPEVVGNAGVLVDPLDVRALAAAMERVAADPGLRAELARRGRERAAKFSWEATSRATLEVCKRVT